nr:hypothetical protein B0A51_11915 [Rachicladosporium sp. CCFEE 5018]
MCYIPKARAELRYPSDLLSGLTLSPPVMSSRPVLADEKRDDQAPWYQLLFNNAASYASIFASVMYSLLVPDADAHKSFQDSLGRRSSGYGGVASPISFFCLVLLCQGIALLFSSRDKVMLSAYSENARSTRPLSAATTFLAFQGLLLVSTTVSCLAVRANVPLVEGMGIWRTVASGAIGATCWILHTFRKTKSQLRGTWMGGT